MTRQMLRFSSLRGVQLALSALCLLSARASPVDMEAPAGAPALIRAEGILATAAAPAAPAAAPPLFLNGSTAHHAFDGVGGLSAGATSRLLFDYPEPQRSDILDLLFKPSHAAALSILKLEVGGDAQSTDGAEASHMHFRDDLSCTRGYEFWLIREAKARNPDILVYALSWAVPAWVGDGEGNGTGYHSPDNWAYQTAWVECVRNTTGTTVDWISDWNEKPMGDPSYILGLRASLDAAGFSSTRITLLDSDYSLNNLVAQAVADPTFNASFASVGRHYSCDYPFPAVEDVLHKPYWSSEDWSMPNTWEGASCLARLVNQNYVRMNMTATIAWSLIWSPPAGLPFPDTGLMTAQEPWSGHYTGKAGGGGGGGARDLPTLPLTGPIWTVAHTTQFATPGWRYLHVPGGGSGLLPPSTGNGSYVTLVPPGDLSGLTIVIEKVVGPCHCVPAGAGETADGVVQFALGGGLPGPGTVLHVWRTNATLSFWQDEDVTVGADGMFDVFVARDSIVTLSTVSTATHGSPSAPIPPPSPLPPPHHDDFDAYAEDTTPVRYFADQTGSFAARSGALTQVVTADPAGNRWTAEDVDPLTLVGDATSITDVLLTVGVTFAPAPKPTGPGAGPFGYTYVQACARIPAYTGFRNGPPLGYCVAVNASGAWAVRAGATLLGDGQLAAAPSAAFDPTAPHTLVLQLQGGVLTAWVVDGPAPASGGATPPTSAPLLIVTNATAYAVGLVALGSGYHTAAFDNFSISVPPAPSASSTPPPSPSAMRPSRRLTSPSTWTARAGARRRKRWD